MRNYTGRVVSGQVSGANINSATKVIGGTSGIVLSLKSIVISNSATAAQTFTIQDSAGTPVVLFPIVYLALNATWSSPEFEPGSYPVAAGRDINIVASTTNVASVAIEAHYLGG